MSESPTMRISELPFEVITIIASSLNRCDLVQAAITCRHIYDACMPCLLREIKIQGRKGGRVVKDPLAALCSVFFRRPDFLGHVSTLRISGDYKISLLCLDDWAVFVGLIGRMEQLREVELSNAERLLCDVPVLGNAVAHCASLRSLSLIFKNAPLGASELLRRMGAPLVKVQVRQGEQQRLTSLFDMLSSFAETLEVLDLSNVDLVEGAVNRGVYPNVQRLRLRNCVMAADVLPQVFPNLRNVELANFDHTEEDYEALGDQDAEQEQEQEAVDDPEDNENRVRWNGLSLVRANLASARVLLDDVRGCRVTHLAISDTLVEYVDARFMRRMLRATNPAIFEVQVEGRGQSLFNGSKLATAAHDLQMLSLRLPIPQICVSQDVTNTIAMLDDLLPLLTPLSSVKYLHIDVRCRALAHARQPFSLLPDYYDIQELADSLYESMPSLVLVVLDWRQAGWHSVKYYSIHEYVEGFFVKRRWTRDSSSLRWSLDRLRWLYENDQALLSDILRAEKDIMSKAEYDELYGSL